MTPEEYAEEYDTLDYWHHIREATAGTDGCSGVPDCNATLLCREHDYFYETHQTPDGDPVVRTWVDALFRHRLVQKANFEPDRAKLWWFGVRALGWAFWMREKPMALGQTVYLEAP